MENRSNVDLIGKTFCKKTAEISQCGNLRIFLLFSKFFEVTKVHEKSKWQNDF